MEMLAQGTGYMKSRTLLFISQLLNEAKFTGGCSIFVLKAQLWKQPQNCQAKQLERNTIKGKIKRTCAI